MTQARDRVPPGQVVTHKWPVLHHGSIPRVDLAAWDFRIFGLVDADVKLTWAQFTGLAQQTVVCDIHCVTHWTRLGMSFTGVPFAEVKRLVRPHLAARFVMIHAEQGFTTNVSLADLDREGVLFALKADGRDLTPEHGWPLRLVVPHLYFWKSAKWVRGLEFMAEDRLGFWEQNGYHRRGDPWRSERYDD